jgi:Zn-dependent M28 family amino/carboxypeptidase
LPGSDPRLRDEWIILSAHFDHLGQQGDTLYPGADDNASGVAMLLEVAEWFALRADRPRRTILFVAFDLEECALLGSTHFAAHPPRDFSKLKAFITADMLGRSMANVMKEYVFALGSETSPRLRQLLEEVQPKGGIKVGQLGADIIGTRGDYGAFRDRRVPFLFLSTGQHPDYHQPSDLPDRLDYEKLQKISQWIAEVTWRLANDVETPSWHEEPQQDLEEVRTILSLVERVQNGREAGGANASATLTSRKRDSLDSFRERLEGILKRGKITPEERTWLVWSTRLLLLTVF